MIILFQIVIAVEAKVRTFPNAEIQSEITSDFLLTRSAILRLLYQKVGIDLGIKTFAILSDRNTFETPSSMKRAKIKLG